MLQMANPDVTDRTLESLKGMKALKELDLNDTQVTDAGLDILSDLPALEACGWRGPRSPTGLPRRAVGKDR